MKLQAKTLLRKEIKVKTFANAREDEILWGIFEKIKPINQFAVEFGARDGFTTSNIRKFLQAGWDGLQMDCDIKLLFLPYVATKIEFITAENINYVFNKHKVPKSFDILSIDVDCNDYWLWKAVDYDPTVVCIEYNSNFDYEKEAIVEYHPDNQWDYTMSYGASFKSMCKLADKKGYYLYAESDYSNLFFIKNKYKKDCPSIFNKEKTILPHEFHHQQLTKKFVTD